MIIKMIHFIGLPDFSRHNIPKYTKWAENVLNGYKIYHLAVK
jgi:hypothetical protein